MISIKFKKKDLNDKLLLLLPKINAMLQMYAVTKSQELKAYMKLKRPWTDRTGNAKAMLNSQVVQIGNDKYRIYLYQGVEYGIWLELANEQNYAIVIPTIREKSQEVFNDVQGMLNKLK